MFSAADPLDFEHLGHRMLGSGFGFVHGL